MKLRGRALLALVAVAVAVAPGGGPAAAAGDDVATVNGEGISRDDFETRIVDLLERQGAAADTITGEQARVVIREMVVNEVLRQRLVAEGIDPESGGELDDSTALVLAERAHYEDLLAEAGVLDVGAVQAAYEETGEANGLLCLRLFIVADGDAGDEARERLDDGEDFADVAADFDPQFAMSAGSISGDPSQPCIDPTVLTEAAAPIIDALHEAGVGTVVGPIETDVATVIAMVPPFDDVRSQFEDAAFSPAIEEMLADAEVTIDPRYGRWDAAAGAVVPLDQPPSESAPVDSVADVAQ